MYIGSISYLHYSYTLAANCNSAKSFQLGLGSLELSSDYLVGNTELKLDS
ncbi:MAG: hypothetical protein ACI86M_003581, partial [Saprospiraceae bacterium]